MCMHASVCLFVSKIEKSQRQLLAMRDRGQEVRCVKQMWVQILKIFDMMSNVDRLSIWRR
jgi:hypothetical protein